MFSDKLDRASKVWAVAINAGALVAGLPQAMLITGALGVSLAIVGLFISSRSAVRGLLVAVLSLAISTISSGSPLYGVLLFVAVLSFLISGSTAVDWEPIIRVLGIAFLFWGYAFAFTMAVAHGAARSSNPIVEDFASPGGRSILFIVVTLYTILASLWVLSPGRGYPALHDMYRFIKRNTALPLEILAFILTSASVYAMHSIIFVVVLLIGIYFWIKNTTKSRILSITIYLIGLYLALHALGAIDAVNTLLAA